MKKLIKICAITGLVLLVLGIGITTVSSAMGGSYRNSLPVRLWSRIWHNHASWTDEWDWGRDEEWDWDWDDYADGPGDTPARSGGPRGVITQSDPSFARAKKLDLDIDKGVIHISEQDDISRIEIHVQDDYDMTQCYMDENTLKIERESADRRGGDAPYIEVLVPAGYEFEKLSLDMGAAECSVLNITTGKLDIDTGVGAVAVSGTVNGNVEIETGAGDVTLNLTGSQDGYNYKVECGVGNINVGNDHYTMLSHETHISNNAPYTMELECGVGNISVNFDTAI